MSGRNCRGCGLPPSIPHALDCGVANVKNPNRLQIDSDSILGFTRYELRTESSIVLGVAASIANELEGRS